MSTQLSMSCAYQSFLCNRWCTARAISYYVSQWPRYSSTGYLALKCHANESLSIVCDTQFDPVEILPGSPACSLRSCQDHQCVGKLSLLSTSLTAKSAVHSFRFQYYALPLKGLVQSSDLHMICVCTWPLYDLCIHLLCIHLYPNKVVLLTITSLILLDMHVKRCRQVDINVIIIILHC